VLTLTSTAFNAALSGFMSTALGVVTVTEALQTVSAHYSRCWHCTSANNTSVRVRQYTQGTIIVDMIDPKRQLSVWRSILDKPRGEQREESLAQGREERAKALFSEFPP
jgi:uncharacterized protein DUF4136